MRRWTWVVVVVMALGASEVRAQEEQPSDAPSVSEATLSEVAEPSAAVEPEREPCEPQERREPWEGFDRPRLALVAGLIQPILLKGGNLELDFYWRRLVLGYSHGFLLNLQGDTTVGAVKEQGLALHLPYSTGLSVGYRFTDWFDFRVEAKAHRFEVRDDQSGDELFAYTTVTLGFGIYAQYRPFHDFGIDEMIAGHDWLNGFVFIFSLRYWPQVWTSLEDDRRSYENPTTGQTEVHDAAEIGIANTPVIFNVAVGYGVTF